MPLHTGSTFAAFVVGRAFGMKRIVFLVLVLCFGFSATSSAQSADRKKVVRQQTVQRKSTETNKAGATTTQSQNNGEVSLTSTTTNQAYGTADTASRAGRRFSIADPTINVLNQRASGSNVPISSSGIVGMPKGTYGFANGKILLRPTTATSSGTVYGSGAVGTGTTIMGVGTGENTPGINGKNPYAGPWLWGTRPSATQTSTAGDRSRKPTGNQ
jgi:hypothetical protein